VFSQHLPWRPDLVLAAVPSILGAAAAVRAAHYHRAPLGVWVQDLMGEAAAQSGIAGGGPAARLVSTIERWLLLQAAGVAVISDSFRSHVERIGIPAERVHQLPNWSHVEPPKHAPSLTRARLGWPTDTIVALHTGNMGLKQGLENVIEAARLAEQRGEPIRFVLMGDGSQRRTLEALGHGLSTLEFLPPVPPGEYADTLAAADVLLINERVGVHDMSLPSKLTSYFIAGRPVVAAVDPGGATAREIAFSGGGLTVRGGRPELLLDAVTRLADNRDLSRSLGARGTTYAESRLNRGEALDRLSSFAQALIASNQTWRSSSESSLTRA
jgi:glycosyltransferase involved in cell wall biosynthesis